MDRITQSIIEDFGNGYASFGHSDLMGRIVGLLLSFDEPMSIEAIANSLNVSRSPVNQICRRLDDLKLIRKAWVKGARKHHYQISESVFLQATINLSRMNEGNLEMAENNLTVLARVYPELNEQEKEKAKIIFERLLLMRNFYRKLLASYRTFIDEWRVERHHIPSIETFVAEMQAEES